MTFYRYIRPNQLLPRHRPGSRRQSEAEARREAVADARKRDEVEPLTAAHVEQLWRSLERAGWRIEEVPD